MNMPSLENVDKLAYTLSLLGDSSRLSIIIYLMNKKANVSEITNYMKISQPAISHHLRVLKDAKIVKSEKKGKEVFYILNSSFVSKIIESGLVELPKGDNNGWND